MCTCSCPTGSATSSRRRAGRRVTPPRFARAQFSQPDPLGTTFTENVEELDGAHVPSWLERRKVNLLEYPLIGGTEKPGARQATIDELRRGTLLWFYVGRGNPFKLADENAFLLSDVEGLANGSSRPFFVANSSSVGPFDSPFGTSIGEWMVKAPNGGSVASYSATGNTFAFANFNLAKALLDALFAPERLADGRTIGDASFRVMDSPPDLPIPPGAFGPGGETYPGNPRDVSMGSVGVVGGRGTTRFVVPLAATPGPDARVLAFVEGRTGRASGARRFTLGAARPDPTDVTGPEISIRLEGIHGARDYYYVFLSDPSGIRALVDSTQHHVTVSIDGELPVDVTAQLYPTPGRHDTATILGLFENLADGMHTVRIEASDNLAVSDADVAHRTSIEVPLRVADVVSTIEERALAFPNPFTRSAGTTVVFTGLRGGSHDVADLEIHDIRGRRLRTLPGRGGTGTIQVPWDGRDEAGRALPAGVYPWRAVLSLYGGIAKEYSGRLVLLD